MELDERLYSRYKSVGMAAQAQCTDGGDILPQLVPSELSGGGLSVGQQASAASRQLVSLVSK